MFSRLATFALAALLSFGLAAAPPPARADGAPAPATPGAAAPDRIDRLVGAARLWAAVKFFHPGLGRAGAPDWDAAFVAALPRLEAAATEADYRAALADLVASLGDLATYVEPPARTPPADTSGPTAWSSTPAPGVLVVETAAIFRADGTPRVAPREVLVAAAKARVLVVDLRRAPGAAPAIDLSAAGLFDDVLPGHAAWPVHEHVAYYGYPSQGGERNVYYAMRTRRAPLPAQPAPAGSAVEAVVYVIDGGTSLYDGVLALQGAGRALIVSTAALGDAAAAERVPVELPFGVVVMVRATEVTMADGGAVAADVIVGRGQDPRARAVALAKDLAKAPVGKARPKRRQAPPTPPSSPASTTDRDWPEAAYPSRELRLFAAIKLWAVFEHFFAYRELVPAWEAHLRTALVDVETSADDEAYVRALARFGARSGDGHVSVWSERPAGAGPRRARTAASIRLVGDALAVVGLADAAEGKALGIAVGDEIVRIDGRSAANLIAEKWSWVSGSTDEARRQRIASNLLWGDEGKDAELVVRGADGGERTVKLPRKRAYLAPPSVAPPTYRDLGDGVGYADLVRLEVSEVGPMFEALGATKALILDMRGYPRGTAWAIAPIINTRAARWGAWLAVPLVSVWQTGARELTLQPLPPSPPRLYRGKIVVLIDDRAISQSEHSCLFFEEAAGVTFIGSPTHGANGNVTVLTLPGGLRASFTGMEVRHVDGRPLQRVGIQPHIVVRPTLAGLRAGKDEVLDRAVAFVKTGR